MLTAGVCSASQTDRSSVLGTEANLSIGRPLAQEEQLDGCRYTAVAAEPLADRSNVVLAQAEGLLDVELRQPGASA